MRVVVVEMLEGELQELGCSAVEVLRTAGPALRRELVHVMVRIGSSKTAWLRVVVMRVFLLVDNRSHDARTDIAASCPRGAQLLNRSTAAGNVHRGDFQGPAAGDERRGAAH